MSTPSVPDPIEVDLGVNGGHVLWRSLDEAQQWIDKELETWRWVDRGGYDAASHVGSTVIGKLDTLRSNAHRYFIGETNPSPCEQSLREIFINDQVPHSSTALCQAILEWGKKDKRSAISGLACLLGIPRIQSFDGNQFQAAVKATLLKLGHGITAASETEAFNNISQHWEKEFHQRRAEIDEAVRGSQRVEDEIRSGMSAFHLFQQDSKREIDELKASFDLELQSIREMYRIELALREPVKYWSDRSNDHRAASDKWGKLSLTTLSLMFVWIFIAAMCIESPSAQVSNMAKEGSIEPSAITSVLALAWVEALAIYGSVTFLLVWPLRIFVRNYMSHSHLEADASERRVLIQTYLALLNDPEVKTNTDLKDRMLPPLLANIFRHTADGIVKDDAWPWQTLVDAIKQK